MRLTNMTASVRGVSAELVIELDGVHYEAVRFGIGTQAADVAQQLNMLAARIVHRATPTPKPIEGEAKI